MADIKITVDSSELKRATQHTEELRGATSRFEAKLKPLIDKERQFNKAVRQVNDAMRLGVATQKQAIAEVERLGKAYGRTQTQIDRTTASMSGIRKNTNRMNATIQNAGYQFGDFFVQVQSGQNVLVAFSQQGAQLAGLLPGLAGAVTGVGLVLGSMLARALLEGTDLFKSFAKASDEAKTAIEDLTSATTAFNSALQGTVGPGAERFAEVVLRKKYNTAVKETTDQLKKLREELSPNTERGFFDPMNLLGIGGMLDSSRALSIVATGAFEARVEMVRLIEAINKPLNFNDMEELDQRLGDIGRLIEEFEDQLTPKQLDGLIEAYSAVYERQKQLLPEQEAVTAEAEGTEEAIKRIVLFTEEILALNRQWESLSSSIEDTFKRTAIQANLIGEGMDRNISSQVASMQMRLDQEKEMLAGLAEGGFLSPGDVGATLFEREQAFAEYIENLKKLQTKPSSSGRTDAPTDQGEQLAQAYAKFQEKLDGVLLSRRQEILLNREIVDLSKEEQDLVKALGVTRSQLTDIQKQSYDEILELRREDIALMKEQEAAAERVAAAEEKVQAVSSAMATETVGALKSIVNGTKTASEAFRDMALNIIQQIMDILIWQPLIDSLTRSISGSISGAQSGGGALGGIVSSIFGFQKGGAFSSGNIIPFANGGVVGSPTMFGMSGGRTGLMGEAGPEAIMPLKRGSDGKLGVEGGGNVTVHQTFNFSANGDESVKKIIAQAAPKIAQMTEAKIINSRQRGGQMRRAFG